MVLPTFLVIGAMKAGTTALNEWLGMHPDCFTAQAKELNYFSLPQLYPDGLEGYARHFAGAAHVPVRGESSPTYAFWPMRPDVPERIADLLPDVRLVYCVREPISRMRSNYLHGVAKGTERRPIDAALLEDPRYVLVSSYALQIQRYLGCLPAEQLHVVCAEDLLRQDATVLAGLCTHLGLDPARLPADLPGRVHVTEDKTRPRSWAAAVEQRTGARGRLWERVSRTPLEDVQVAPATRDELLTRLRPDLEALRPWLPAGHDGWGLLGG